MDITLQPRKLRGEINIIPSKSQAHRLLICAAFADKVTQLHCPETNRDIEATAECLSALGAQIQRTPYGYCVQPIGDHPQTAILNCCESGSTLRFLLPIAGAMGVDATFQMEGRLPQRPLSPLWEEMERMGCSLTRPTADTIRFTGKLRPGAYSIAGNVSSQYVTGLLFSLSLLEAESTLTLTGKVESTPYIKMTEKALSLFSVKISQSLNTYSLKNAHFTSPGHIYVEGDWSNGAFWTAAHNLGCELSVQGLDTDSVQGDRAVLEILPRLCTGTPTVSAADFPDLVPILSVFAAANKGAVFTDIQRLRIKESDRVESTVNMIRALGGKAEAKEDTLTVFGTGLTGGTVDTVNDHRIAMSAAIAATVCTEPVTILDAQCVNKSYPQFWAEYARLGGLYEQHLR